MMEFQEKSAITAFDHISTACYYLQERDVASISKYLRGGGDPDSLGGFVHWLTIQGRMLAGYSFSSHWFDIGTREKLLEANSHFLVDVRRGRVEGNTRISGPAQIEPFSTIRDSEVGPMTYIGKEAQLIGSSVSNSIVMDGVIIRNSNIRDSIIGPRSIIEGGIVATVCGPDSLIIAANSGR